MKKLIALLQIYIMLFGTLTASASCNCSPAHVPFYPSEPICPQEQVCNTEHMFYEKCSANDKVVITNARNIICKGNVFKVAFDCKFQSECAKAGQCISFTVPEAIYTREGTLLIPACSKVRASVIKINHQQRPNKNAQVYLKFDCIVFPDGCTVPMAGMPFTKDNSLKEGKWMTTGKVAANTVGLGIIGAGAATGFAFIPHPLKLGVAYAIGIPVGMTIGLATGLLSAGLKYHAKAGEPVMVVICNDLCLPRQCSSCCQ